jgi:hypothetical protein
MKTTLRIAAAFVLFAPAAGAAPSDARTTNDLRQIGLAYQNLFAVDGKAPAKAEDLAPYFDNNKRLLDLLKNEDVVFFYNVTPLQMTSGSSNTVLAYVKDVPDKGGLVLMGDGSVKKMSADEFKKATLAGKRKEK